MMIGIMEGKNLHIIKFTGREAEYIKMISAENFQKRSNCLSVDSCKFLEKHTNIDWGKFHAAPIMYVA